MTDKAQELEGTSEALKPFFMKLKTKHTVDKTTSRNVQQLEAHEELRQYAHDVATLQALSAAEDSVGYSSARDEFNNKIKLQEASDAKLKAKGLTFRQTKGQVYLDAYEGETVEVEVAVQVKGNSLTCSPYARDALTSHII